MGLESSFNFIDDLDSTNPAAGDNVSEGDDHLRGTKNAVKGSFPSLGSAAVTKTAAQINDLVDKSSAQSISGAKTFTANVLLEKASPQSIIRCADEATENTILSFQDELGVARALIYRPAGFDYLIIDARDSLGAVQAALHITEAGNISVVSGVFTATGAELTSPVINTGVSGTAGVKGIFILDNPETLYSSATYTSATWTSSSGFASTTLATAGATGAIVRLFVRMHWLTDTDVQANCGLRKAGEADTGIPTYIDMQRANLNSNALNQVAVCGEGTVALDASSDFEFNFGFDTGVAPTIDQNFTVTLIGYYV